MKLERLHFLLFMDVPLPCHMRLLSSTWCFLVYITKTFPLYCFSLGNLKGSKMESWHRSTVFLHKPVCVSRTRAKEITWYPPFLEWTLFNVCSILHYFWACWILVYQKIFPISLVNSNPGIICERMLLSTLKRRSMFSAWYTFVLSEVTKMQTTFLCCICTTALFIKIRLLLNTVCWYCFVLLVTVSLHTSQWTVVNGTDK